MFARRSLSLASSRVRVVSEQKTASVVSSVVKAVEAHPSLASHAKAATQKNTGILRNPNMTLTTEELARGRLATLDRRTDQARLEQMQADGSWWTGKAPSKCAGWISATETSPEWLSSLALPNLAAPTAATRQQTLDYFDNTWTLTELLFTAVRDEASLFLPPYHQLRHPLIFYYGHVAALYINKLRLAEVIDEPINIDYEAQLFEVSRGGILWSCGIGLGLGLGLGLG